MRKLGILAALLLGACSGETHIPDTPVFHSENPKLLSKWGIVSVSNGTLTPSDESFVYELNSALFSDYAHKLRTVYVPPGTETSLGPDGDAVAFPIGTIISKTFYYPRWNAPNKVMKTTQISGQSEPLSLSQYRLIETRLLVHRDNGWHALPYVWNDAQTEATLERSGTVRRLELVDGDQSTEFAYLTPDTNQCAGCHATNNTTRAIVPIGPKLRHLKTLNPFDIADLPESYAHNIDYQDSTFSLDQRARAYLDINCSHCHNEVGPADTSGLHLELKTKFGPNLGLCKTPIAAGTGTGNRKHGIVPGDPDASIFVFRMNSINPASMMPELGRSLSHDEGVQLISDWISELEGNCGM